MSVSVRSRPPEDGDRYVPSVDRLFISAAKLLGRRAVAVVMTGMGDDGTEGVRAIKAAGGTVLVESRETAIVFSMPEAAIRTGLCDDILPLPALANRIAELVS